MNKCVKCPHCGIEDSKWHGSGVKYRHCLECGTEWQEDYPAGAKIPRRSQPADELSLPDADDWWWWWNPARGGKWEPVCVDIDYLKIRMSRVGLLCDEPCPPGRYVRLPMPVQPKPVDEDAAFLRKFRGRINLFDGDIDRLEAIADRLERQGKEPA